MLQEARYYEKKIYKMLKENEKIFQCHEMLGIQSKDRERCIVLGWCDRYAVICRDGETVKEWKGARAKKYALKFMLETLENN